MNRKLKFSASIMCANFLRLEDDIRALEAAGCDELHFDIMDGQFVPNLTFGFDMVRAVRSCTELPINAHLMIATTDWYLERFCQAGCNSVTLHVEAVTHAQRALVQLRELGVSPGIALNPATPLTKVEYLLDYADRVSLMTVDPGFAGQRIIPNAFERVKIVREVLDYRKLNVEIEVDGNINVENAAILANQGASIFVLGTASIFRGGENLEAALPAFKQAVAKARHLV